jgi:hypothetical protein
VTPAPRNAVRLVRRPGTTYLRWMARIRPSWLSDEVLDGLRWGLTVCWVLAFAYQVWTDGLPLYRSDLLVWIVALLVATSIGKRGIFTVLIDFLPFAAVLIAYDYLRGISDTLGMPTWWHPQVDIDKFLFFGHEPTVWLQEHLKKPTPHWWDAVVALCYFSFFFLPYITAGGMWFRSRADFYRWGGRFVALSFIGFSCFALIPAAPPWAAARCSAAQVAAHPSNPLCVYYGDPRTGGLLGKFTSHQPGANAYVERISTRGFGLLHINLGFYDIHFRFAAEAITAGQGGSDLVAAVPSLHLGGTMLFCVFMWSRLRKAWRPVLIAYPLLMSFSLVYSAEHYVTDCLAGALLALAVHVSASAIERRRKRRPGPDTLGDRADPPDRAERTEPTQESQCPPTPPQPATTPSST